MAVPLRRATGAMKILSWVLLLFVIEVILETGIQLKSLLVTGLSVKNVFLLAFFVYVFFKSNGSLKWAEGLGLRKIILLYILLTVYSALSLSFPSLIGIQQYSLVLASTSFKNEMLDSFLCMLIFTYFASRPGLGSTMLQGLLIIIGISAALTVLDATVTHGKIFGFSENTMRTKGALGEPNQTAAVYSMYAPIIAAMVLSGRKAILNLVLLGLLLMAVLVTGSRGGMVASAVGLLFTLWACRPYISVQRKLLFALAAPFAAMLIWALLPEYYKDLILARFFFESKAPVSMRELSAGRTLIWEYAVDFWLRSPIIGSGWYGFAASANFATHNTYVEYVVSIGIVGIGIFLYLWSNVFSSLKKMTRNSPLPKQYKILIMGCCGGVIAIMTAIFFVNLYKPWLIVWMGIGTMLGYMSVTLALYRRQAAQMMADANASQAAADSSNPAPTDGAPALRRTGYLRANEGL